MFRLLTCFKNASLAYLAVLAVSVFFTKVAFDILGRDEGEPQKTHVKWLMGVSAFVRGVLDPESDLEELGQGDASPELERGDVAPIDLQMLSTLCSRNNPINPVHQELGYPHHTRPASPISFYQFWFGLEIADGKEIQTRTLCVHVRRDGLIVDRQLLKMNGESRW